VSDQRIDVEETTEADIETYVKERLARTPGSPYASHPADIATIGAKIAQNAHGRSLFARIAVSGLLERPYIPTAEIDETTGDSVGEALARDLDNQDKLFNAKFARDVERTRGRRRCAYGTRRGLLRRQWPARRIAENRRVDWWLCGASLARTSDQKIERSPR
jgi:hypothetical protein